MRDAGGPTISKRRSVVYALFLILVSLGLLEGAGQTIRFLFHLGPDVPGIHVPDRTRLWVMRPNIDQMTPKGKHHVITNSLGFRGPELRSEASGRRVRILVLGDSVSFGFAVEEADSWPRMLERLLDEEAGGAPYEVVNTGVLGYGTFQEAMVFRRFGAVLAPDLTILQFYPNDPLENYTYRPLSTLRMLLPRSALYNLLRAAYLRLRGASNYRMFDPGAERDAFAEASDLAREKLDMRHEEAVFSTKDPALLRKAWARTDDAVGMIRDEATRIDTKLVAVAFPSMGQVIGANRSTVYQDSLAAICARHEIPLIDLLGDFAGKAELYKVVHPSVRGNAEAARIVRDELRARGLL